MKSAQLGNVEVTEGYSVKKPEQNRLFVDFKMVGV
jgi:hypothetical protein